MEILVKRINREGGRFSGKAWMPSDLSCEEKQSASAMTS